jgi:hypothetical protein
MTPPETVTAQVWMFPAVTPIAFAGAAGDANTSDQPTIAVAIATIVVERPGAEILLLMRPPVSS